MHPAHACGKEVSKRNLYHIHPSGDGAGTLVKGLHTTNSKQKQDFQRCVPVQELDSICVTVEEFSRSRRSHHGLCGQRWKGASGGKFQRRGEFSSEPENSIDSDSSAYSGLWQPFVVADIQLKFVSIDPSFWTMLKPIGGGRYETKFEILDMYQFKVDSDRSCTLRRRSHTHYERFIPSIYVLRDYGTADGTRVEVYFTARGFRQRQAQNSLIVDQAQRLSYKTNRRCWTRCKVGNRKPNLLRAIHPTLKNIACLVVRPSGYRTVLIANYTSLDLAAAEDVKFLLQGETSQAPTVPSGNAGLLGDHLLPDQKSSAYGHLLHYELQFLEWTRQVPVLRWLSLAQDAELKVEMLHDDETLQKVANVRRLR
ncbi:dolichyl-diphosphooligosaccharide protein glycotransferase [Culex quinquefasciatus]|uniref:Dolichyl-diphosphooligosaccharide protein glycotransferase n=1 Tax=Culex quinquefasciatus TaxID=7176 RepID=B0WD51_CULQU|nr:dolichyl-diphosphooligosaccharide protein glycotransferase [Culex quinquefasciatus]|eukprot:XP_001846635.1 dolichyl-diphosphooligosaccharide protein glycotransferase [Culex quinquefasciatus]